MGGDMVKQLPTVATAGFDFKQHQIRLLLLKQRFGRLDRAHLEHVIAFLFKLRA